MWLVASLSVARALILGKVRDTERAMWVPLLYTTSKSVFITIKMCVDSHIPLCLKYLLVLALVVLGVICVPHFVEALIWWAFLLYTVSIRKRRWMRSGSEGRRELLSGRPEIFTWVVQGREVRRACALFPVFPAIDCLRLSKLVLSGW